MLSEQESEERNLLQRRDASLRCISNLLHAAVPVFEDERDNAVLRSWNHARRDSPGYLAMS